MSHLTLDSLFFSRREISISLDLFLARKAANHHPGIREKSGEISLQQFRRLAPKFIGAALKAIEGGDYLPRPARRGLAPGNKPRVVYHFELPDSFILSHLGRTFQRISEPLLSECVYSFRKGFGNLAALGRAAAYIRENDPPFYIARRDIARFGEQLDHGILHKDFAQAAHPSPSMVRLFTSFCAFPYYDENRTLSTNTVGLPTGSHLQLVCENLYLAPIDETFFREPGALYLRFGDDILLAHRERERFVTLCALLDRLIASRRLSQNPIKSSDICLAKSHQVRDLRHSETLSLQTSFVYLGWRITERGTLLALHERLEALRRFLKERLAAVALQAADLNDEARIRLLCRAAGTLLKPCAFRTGNPAIDYILPISDHAFLKQFDRWLALSVLQIGTCRGFKQANLRRFSLKHLRSFGLPSVVHLRRLRGL